MTHSRFSRAGAPTTFRGFVKQWARSRIDIAAYLALRAIPHAHELLRTRRLRGTESSRCAFVFANGPSVRLIDPYKINRLQRSGEFHLFGVNSYAYSDFAQIAPADRYVLSDPMLWTRRVPPEAREVLPAEQRVEADKALWDDCDRTWDALAKSKPTLFVPVERVAGTAHKPTYGFCDALDLASDNVLDITRPLALRPLTAYKALSIACFLGYRKIYICGIDNDGFRNLVVDQDNVKRGPYEHFYDPPEAVVQMESRSPLADSLFHMSLTFGCLQAFQRFPIVNLDPGGLVDVFSKRHELDVYR
jgi:hypothetical protein